MVSDYDQHSYNQDNRQIVIYPQGTRVYQIKQEYKVGAGVLYGKFNLPYHLVGTFAFFGQKEVGCENQEQQLLIFLK